MSRLEDSGVALESARRAHGEHRALSNKSVQCGCYSLRLLLLHLSDIHIQSAEDAVLSRASAIGAALRSRDESADLVLCLVSGDISYSGTTEQFDIARTFLNDIASAIGGTVHFAVVPGNHDLDFEQANAAREALMKAVLQTPGEAIDGSIAQVLATPQRSFFEFRDKMRTTDAVLSGDSVGYDYEFAIANGECVTVRCINTALLSTIKEKPGTLVAAAQLAGDVQHKCFTVTVFHHPYNWLNPASKNVIRALEKTSDLILTGHEHEHGRAINYRPEAYVATTYIEAAALQQHSGAEDSAFNALLVDTAKGLYKFFHFQWDGTRYASSSVIGEWEVLPLLAIQNGFPDVVPEFASWLNDAGIPGENKREKRTLSELFLYPDLSEAFSDPLLKRKRSTVKGEDVFRTTERKAVAFISGLPKSGRTALARKLFLDFAAAGYVPLYLDGVESGMRAADSLPAIVERQVKTQYGQANVEAYFQLPKDRRVILLDNAERVKGRRVDRIQLVQTLANFAGHVVVLGDDSAGGITEMNAEDFAGNTDGRGSYSIEEFDHAHREELAQRWFDGDAADEEEASHNLERAEQILDTVIGRSYVPAFPIYVLALIRAVDEGGAIDPKASTHGYFYDLLIRQALTARSQTKDVGTRFAFLTHLASEMYAVGSREILESQLRESFRRYDETYAVGRLTYDKLIPELVDRGMLTVEGDTVRFRYPYLYNYFVANHLNRTIATADTRTEVTRLTQNLGDDQANDILMFLAHLSSDSFVIESLLETANQYLTEYEPETLEAITQDHDDDLELEYVEPESQGAARKQLAKRRDAQLSESELDSSSSGAKETVKVAGNVAAALHTIRVMGQIVKNFPGVLDKEIKATVINASCELGLRLLRLVLEKVDAGRKELLERIVDFLRALSPDMPKEKLKARAERYLYVLSIASAYGILRVMSASLASEDLDPIYDIVFSGQISAARKLINLGLRLDTSRVFPEGLVTKLADDLEGLRLASILEKLLVLNHFDRIHVAPSKRQSICAKLGIKYQVLPSRNIVGLKRR